MFPLFFESVRIAVDSILSNKIRSFLTGLSIIIGILTVTLMGTLISGLDRGFEKSMDFLGKDVLSISCLLYTSPSPRDGLLSRMPSSA